MWRLVWGLGWGVHTHVEVIDHPTQANAGAKRTRLKSVCV